MRVRSRPSRSQALASSLGAAAVFTLGYGVGDATGAFADRSSWVYGGYFVAVTVGAFAGNRFWTRRLPKATPVGPSRVADASTR